LPDAPRPARACDPYGLPDHPAARGDRGSARRPSSAPTTSRSFLLPRPCPSRSTSFRSLTAMRKLLGWPISSRASRASSHRSRNSTVSASMGSTSTPLSYPTLARPSCPGAEREHGRANRRAALHRLVSRQGGSLRREADRLPREGSQLRRLPPRGWPLSTPKRSRVASEALPGAQGSNRTSALLGRIPKAGLNHLPETHSSA
jgi:hypothetical protein